jgi:hypothetical protein
MNRSEIRYLKTLKVPLSDCHGGVPEDFGKVKEVAAISQVRYSECVAQGVGAEPHAGYLQLFPDCFQIALEISDGYPSVVASSKE